MFAKRLAVMRNVRDLSQSQLGETVGINRQIIWLIERSSTRPEPELEAQIRAALRWGPAEDAALDVLMGNGQAEGKES